MGAITRTETGSLAHGEQGAAFYAPQVETLPREQLAALQLERLRASVRHAGAKVPLHRRRLAEAGVQADDLRQLSDVRQLPFTSKADLRDHYPFGMFALPVDELARLHASSGTTGKPTVVGYSAADLDTWSELMARTLYCAGARRGDVLHNAYGYGLFTGGLGFHYGAEALGCAVIPVSGGFTERQVQLIADFRPDIIAATPSYLLAIADEL
ncbi:MAG: phenylacetate--CoA ligase, partial [Burkholderiales bacterium]|nr:phenylacetate--CoA ligase [Burkholderiales bacterium]